MPGSPLSDCSGQEEEEGDKKKKSRKNEKTKGKRQVKEWFRGGGTPGWGSPHFEVSPRFPHPPSGKSPQRG